MYSSILATEAAKNIPQKVVPAAASAGLPSSSFFALGEALKTGDFTNVPGMSPQIRDAVAAAVKQAYARSYRTVYLCTLPFGALLILAALFSPNVERYLTDEVARKLQGAAQTETSEECSDGCVEKV